VRVRILAAVCLSLSLPAAAVAQEPRLSDDRVVMETISGDVVIALYPDVAPEHAKQILNLVRLGCYDHTHFDHVEPGFILQLADVSRREEPFALTEAQRGAIRPVKAEFSQTLKHRRGVLSMARAAGQPDSATTSFSILLGDAPHLDGQYTIFGEVVYGMDVVDKLVQVPPLFIDPKSAPVPMIPLDVYKMEVVSADDLNVSKLTPAHDVELPPDKIADAYQLAWSAHRKALEQQAGRGSSMPEDLQLTYLLTGGLLMVILLSLASFVGAGRLSQRWVISLNMLSILIGGFLLLVVLTPVSQRNMLVGVLVFVAFFGIFKLLSRFESVG
jgi:cyclophilin family peptidyl-prolyl cis-trans isomerase